MTMPQSGWATLPDGRLTFTQVGGDYLTADAPTREGWRPYFVAKHTGFTQWIYRKEQS